MGYFLFQFADKFMWGSRERLSVGGWFAVDFIIYNLFFGRKGFCRTLACRSLNTLIQHYVIPIKLFHFLGRLLRLALGLTAL